MQLLRYVPMDNSQDAEQQRLSHETTPDNLIVISQNYIEIKLTKPIVTVAGL